MMKAYPLSVIPMSEHDLRIVLRYLVCREDPKRDNWFSGPMELYYGKHPAQLLLAKDEPYRSYVEPMLIQIWCTTTTGLYHYKFDGTEAPTSMEAFVKFSNYLQGQLPYAVAWAQGDHHARHCHPAIRPSLLIPTPEQFQQLKVRSIDYEHARFPKANPKLIPLIRHFNNHPHLTTVLTSADTVKEGDRGVVAVIFAATEQGVHDLHAYMSRMMDYLQPLAERAQQLTAEFNAHGIRDDGRVCEELGACYMRRPYSMRLSVSYKLIPNTQDRYPAYVLSIPVENERERQAACYALNHCL